MKALALLSNLRSADIVLPTTDGREIRLRRITEPDAEQESLLHQLRLSPSGTIKIFSPNVVQTRCLRELILNKLGGFPTVS
jgi:hypothetical protein